MREIRKRPLTSIALIYQVLKQYRLDGAMEPDLLDQMLQATIGEILENLPREERLKGLPAEERLKGLSIDDLLAALPPETREALARRLKGNGSPPKGGGS